MATILIVDERHARRETLARVLAEAGHRLIEASDGAKGVAIARTERPSVIISDILLPNMDGGGFVRRLRADPKTARTPVIFSASRYHLKLARQLARSCGVSHIIGRPSAANGILRTVEAVLTKAPAEPAPIEEGDLTNMDTIHRDTIDFREWTEELDDSRRTQFEERLQQQKMEAMGRLAGGVAHDFNNLLTVIIGYSDFILTDVPSTEPVARLVEQIRSAGHRASLLTRQLLAFSRRQVVLPVSTDLNAILAETMQMLGRLLSEQLELEVNAAPELWKIKVDPGQIEQVVVNLAVNARDAMPGGGKLTISTANVELDASQIRDAPWTSPGEYVQMTVCDTGCGMDEATCSHIFEPFFTTKGRDGGTGLGLATVIAIVKQCRGRIEVTSKPGAGTTFDVYFPREVQSSEADAAHSVRSAPTTRIDLSPGRG